MKHQKLKCNSGSRAVSFNADYSILVASFLLLLLIVFFLGSGILLLSTFNYGCGCMCYPHHNTFSILIKISWWLSFVYIIPFLHPHHLNKSWNATFSDENAANGKQNNGLREEAAVICCTQHIERHLCPAQRNSCLQRNSWSKKK